MFQFVSNLENDSFLLQGVDLQEWESQQHEASLTSTLEQKENELRCLRQGSRVTVEDITLLEDKHLDKQVHVS